MTRIRSREIPPQFKPFFWDCNFKQLHWENDRDFIINRILLHGNWDSIRCLNARVGDSSLREWILQHQGGQLSPPQLRFWELVLKLPKPQVSSWINTRRKGLWEQRIYP